MARQQRRPRLRRLRAWVAQSGIVVLACVLLLGVLRAGARYYVCPAMSVVLDAPCCADHDEADGEDDGAAALRAGDCCRAKRLARMPTSAVPAMVQVAAAPCVGVLPPRIDGCDAQVAAATARFSQPARAGPATATERRAALMVWLI